MKLFKESLRRKFEADARVCVVALKKSLILL